MLLVVLGAGASLDFAAQRLDELTWRPPVTDGLVEDSQRNRRLLNLIPGRAASGLVATLRQALAPGGGTALEATLDKMSQEAGEETREFLAFRFYLQSLLQECSTRGVAEVGGATNHSILVRTIELWRRRRNERVLYVTFNYDTILDQALAGQYDWEPHLDSRRLDRYISSDEFRLFKLHGSCNWGQAVHDTRPELSLDLDTWDAVECRREMLDMVTRAEMTLADDYRLLPPVVDAIERCQFRTKDGKNHLLVPALAIPLATKAAFACPVSHQLELVRHLPLVDRVLAIGWKGGESHFVKLLTKIRAESRLLVVDPSEETLRRVPRLLQEASVPLLYAQDDARHLQTSTFSQFIAGEGLTRFLEDSSD